MLLDELVKGLLGNEIISLYSAELFHKVGGYEPFHKDITEESKLHFILLYILSQYSLWDQKHRDYIFEKLRNTKIVPDDNIRQWTYQYCTVMHGSKYLQLPLHSDLKRWTLSIKRTIAQMLLELKTVLM